MKDDSVFFSSASSAEVVLLLLEALLGHGVLNGDDVFGCVTLATFSLCESAPANHCASAAGMAVLDAALRTSSARSNRHLNCEKNSAVVVGRSGRGGIGTDNESGGGVVAGAHGFERASAAAGKAAASSRVLAAIESILRFRESEGSVVGTPRPDDGGGASSPFMEAQGEVGVSEWLYQDGCWFGASLRGMMDAPVSLLVRAVAGATTASPFVATIATPSTRSPTRKPPLPEAVAATAAASPSHKRLWLLLCEQLRRGGSGELSPAGLVNALRYAEGVLATAPIVEDVEVLLLGGEGEGAEGGGVIDVVCAMVLEHRHLRAVKEWPPRGGGGMAGAAAIITAAVGAMQASLASDGSHEALLRVQQAMHSRGLVAALLAATRVLRMGGIVGSGRGTDGEEARKTEGAKTTRGRDGGGGGSSFTTETRQAVVGDDGGGDVQQEAALCACVELLSRLVLLSPHFSAQFLEEEGLKDLVSAGSLRETAPAALATGALVIASHLARTSADNYRRLRAARVDASLGALLAHADHVVRAKACNLVGNLCRHSAFFYAALQEAGRRGSGRPDEGMRGGGGGERLAQHHQPPRDAAGRLTPPRPPRREQHQQNPAEHPSRRLAVGTEQEDDKSVVDRLVDLCADPDPSARKFACFAVGNAAFHNGALYARLASAVAPLVTALDDPEEKTRANAAGALGNLVRNGGALSGDLARRGGVRALLDLAARDPAPSPRRIALFSLGTCCAYIPCREALALLLEGEEVARNSDRSTLLHAVPPQPWDGVGGGGGGGRGGRQRWKNIGHDGVYYDAVPSRPAAGLLSAATAAAAAAAAAAPEGMVTPGFGLDLCLSKLEQAAVGVGDDVARKYVVRLRTKLSAPPQA